MTDIVKVINDVVTVSVGDTGLKGRPGIVWRGLWSGSVDYYAGDVVKYNGSTFICSSFIAANESAYPTSTPENWSLFAEKGAQGEKAQNVILSDSPPGSACAVSSFSNEAECIAGGSSWVGPSIGDLWFDTAVGRLYALVADSEGDQSWFDISGVVGGSVTANDISVEASGELPSGTLQDVLKHLEDQMFTSATTPTGSTTDEGDLWYDTSTDQMKFLRNGVWEVLVQTSATADTNGYDSINLNGGYF